MFHVSTMLPYTENDRQQVPASCQQTIYSWSPFLELRGVPTPPIVVVNGIMSLFRGGGKGGNCSMTSLLSFQVVRKRHIGNDIVTVIFQEPGSAPFTPAHFRSHYQHVFIVVRVHSPNTPDTNYE